MALTVLFRRAGFQPAFLTLAPLFPRKFSLQPQRPAFRSDLFVAYTSVCVGQVFTAGPSSARLGLVAETAREVIILRKDGTIAIMDACKLSSKRLVAMTACAALPTLGIVG